MFCVRGLPTILFAFLSLPFHLHLCVVGDVLDIKNFNLRPNALGTALRDRADKLGEVLGAKASVTKIMGNLNRPEGAGNVSNGQPCNPRAVAVRVDIEKSICFDSGDTNTDQWYPQGVTTVADMQADQSWGDGLRPILVSWYHNDTDGEGVDKGVRISFVDSVGGKYRHVLLVYPQMLDSGDPTYNSIRVSQNPEAKGYKTSLHAGGILWYGNHLYVADTARGFRMFDMRRIYDLGESPRGRTSSPELIGLYIGAYYGHGYRYIMPQVGSWTRTADPGKTCSDSNDLAPNFSYVSLDRSGTDALVVGEYCNGSIKGWPAGEKKSKGRVVVWEIGESLGRDGELITESNYRWSAVNAYKLPVSNVQGATRFKGKWYLSQSNGTNNAGKLHITEATTTTTTDLKVASSQPLGFGPEDLSHWPKGTGTDQALGVLWTVGEHVGKRMLYSVVPE